MKTQTPTNMKPQTKQIDQHQRVSLAQDELNNRIAAFYDLPSNSDGGSADDRYHILFRVAKKYDVEPDDLYC